MLLDQDELLILAQLLLGYTRWQLMMRLKLDLVMIKLESVLHTVGGLFLLVVGLVHATHVIVFEFLLRVGGAWACSVMLFVFFQETKHGLVDLVWCIPVLAVI